MGIGNWLLKNGPGSPGSTAKHYADQFLQLKASNSGSDQEIWSTIYHNRHQTAISIRNGTHKFDCFDPEPVFGYCEGDIALFTFVMQYIESESFRKAVGGDQMTLNQTLEATREVVQKRAPQLITLDHLTYRNRAISFMSELYPDLAH